MRSGGSRPVVGDMREADTGRRSRVRALAAGAFIAVLVVGCGSSEPKTYRSYEKRECNADYSVCRMVTITKEVAP
jgi:hypothetical protein